MRPEVGQGSEKDARAMQSIWTQCSTRMYKDHPKTNKEQIHPSRLKPGWVRAKQNSLFCQSPGNYGVSAYSWISTQ